MTMLLEGLSDRARKERLAQAIIEKRKRDDRAYMESNLYEFVRESWPSIESATFQDSWAIEALCAHLEAVTRGHIKRLLLNFPPRCGKSTVTSICWPAWVWAQSEESFVSGPGTQFLCASYNHSLSLKLSTSSRRLLQSPFYQEYWGDRFELQADQNSKTQFDNDRGGTRISTSVGGSLIGIGGSVLLADDPHNTEQVESDAERETVHRWWKEFSVTRLNDPNQSAIVVVMQRLNENDVSGIILESKRDWTHLMLPMRYEPQRHCVTSIGPGIEWEDPRGETGEELMWPERFGQDKVTEMEIELGPYMASGRLQQRPTPAGGGIIKHEWWQLWDEPAYPHCYYKWASADTAYTEKEANDPTGFTAWGLFDIAGQPNIILLDAWRKRLELHVPARWTDDGTPDTRLQKVLLWQKAAQTEYRALQANGKPGQEPLVALDVEPWAGYIKTGQNESQRWPAETYDNWRLRTQDKWGLCEWLAHSCRRFNVHELIIEGKASGLTVAQELRRLNGNEGWGIKTVTPEGDKTARLYAVQATFSAGLVHAPDRVWSQMAIEEVCQFPKHRFRDVTDSTSQALKHIRELGLLQRPEERQLAADLSAQYRAPSKPLYPGSQ